MSFKLSDYFFLLGAVSILLGFLGWKRAKSVVSLIAGGISGIALASAALLVMIAEREGRKPTGGYLMGLCICVLLLGRFLPGFLKSKKIYPAGIMSAGAFIGMIVGLIGWLNATGWVKT